ncbi:MAG: iron-containing alcohol dehydrogenase family protein, partial [Actinomycetes bacterium]
ETPLYIDIRKGALDDLATVLADQRVSSTGHIAVVMTEGGKKKFEERLKKAEPKADFYISPGNSLDDAKALAENLKPKKYDAIVGVGGGRVIDLCKYAATLLEIPMISVATNLAHDGVASPVSILENNGGRGSFGVNAPLAVVIDLDAIKMAPDRFIKAGIGDVLSNLSAVKDWELAVKENGEKMDGLAASMARISAEALLGRADSIGSDDFLVALSEALVLSGIAMGIAGTSRPCSGACHEISHAIDLLFPDRTQPHGEQVGVGALFATFLRNDEERFTELAYALSQHGLPISHHNLGFNDEEFTEIVKSAPTTRPDRFTILEHLNMSENRIKEKIKEFNDAIASIQI